MYHQATVKEGRGAEPADALGRSVSDFKTNLVTLAELQMKLLGEDLKQGVRQIKLPAAFLVVALALLLACTPLALVAIAVGVSALTELHIGWSLAVVTLLGFLTAGGLAWYASAKLRSSVTVVNRSRDELAQNVRYLKSALRDSTRRDVTTPGMSRTMW